MSEQAPPRGYLISVVHPGSAPSLDDIRRVLRDTGVQLDADYGPFLVDADQGEYVVRGTADPQARRRAEALPGVTFFGDPEIGPTGGG